jgi:hypothetical protein
MVADGNSLGQGRDGQASRGRPGRPTETLTCLAIELGIGVGIAE